MKRFAYSGLSRETASQFKSVPEHHWSSTPVPPAKILDEQPHCTNSILPLVARDENSLISLFFLFRIRLLPVPRFFIAQSIPFQTTLFQHHGLHSFNLLLHLSLFSNSCPLTQEYLFSFPCPQSISEPMKTPHMTNKSNAYKMPLKYFYFSK